MDILVDKENSHVDAIFAVLNEVCYIPERPINTPISTSMTGGSPHEGPTRVDHPARAPPRGFDFANPDDNVSLNIKGMQKNSTPQNDDVTVYKKNTTLGPTKKFAAQIQALNIPRVHHRQ